MNENPNDNVNENLTENPIENGASPQPAASKPTNAPQADTPDHSWQFQAQPAASPETAPVAPTTSGEPTPGAPQPTPAPVQQPGFTPTFDSSKPPKRSRRKLIALIIIIAVVLAAIGTYVFAIYIPGRPENVWKSGLGNTGSALTGLTKSVTSSDSLKKLSTSKIDGTYSYTSTPASATATSLSGTFSTTFDSSTFNADVTAKDPSNAATNIGAQVIGRVPSGSTYPDVYFKISGLDSLPADSDYASLALFNNQWFELTSSYISSLTDSSSTKSLTSSDFTDLSNAVTKTLNADVFTSDESKSIIQRQSFVGHEKKNGRDAYHYKATVNADRYKSFCSDLLTNISKTSFYTKTSSDSNLSSDIKDCQDSTSDSALTSKPFDVWIDSGYRILTAVKIDDKSDSGYAEIGQKLDNTNVPSFYVTGKDADGNPESISLTYNRSSLNATFDASIISKDSDTTTKMTAHATLAPFSGSVPYNPPSDSTDIQSLLEGFGVSSDDFSSDTTF